MDGRIQQLFKEQQVNISDMSRRTGIPYGTLYDIAIGKTDFGKIRIGALLKLAHEFGMKVDDLVGDSDVDQGRYELCRIYDDLGETGRQALLACANGLHDVFIEEAEDAMYQSMAEDQALNR